MKPPAPTPKATFKMLLAWRLMVIAVKLHPPIVEDLARSALLGVKRARKVNRRG